MADDAAAVALRLGEAVVGEEARGMRVAADAAHLVAADAVRRVSLVVAAGAAGDVAPGGVAVELPRAGHAPAWRMRIERARTRGDVLELVAVLAEAGPVAALARRRVRPLIHRVPPEEILAGDETAVGPIDQLGLDRHHRGLGVAVEAEVLV